MTYRELFHKTNGSLGVAYSEFIRAKDKEHIEALSHKIKHLELLADYYYNMMDGERLKN